MNELIAFLEANNDADEAAASEAMWTDLGGGSENWTAYHREKYDSGWAVIDGLDDGVITTVDPQAVDGAVIVGFCFFGSSFLRKDARHSQIRTSVRRIPLQQRQQHLLGRIWPAIGENCQSERGRVRRVVVVERGRGAKVLNGELDPSLREELLARTELASRVRLAPSDVHSGERGVEQKECDDDSQHHRECRDEFGHARGRNRRRLNDGSFHRSGCSL